MQTSMDQFEIFIDGARRRPGRLRAMANMVIAAQHWGQLLLEKKAFKHLSRHYKIELRSLVRDDHKSDRLSELGGIQGVAQHLNTNLHTGIGSVIRMPTSEKDELVQSGHLREELALRRHIFGTNTQSIKQRKRILFWETLQKNFRSEMIQNVYILCAVVLLALGIANSQMSTGCVLLISTILNAGVNMGIDFCRSNCLQNLAMQGEQQMQAHVRRCGRRWRVSTCEIVVGDLVELCCGDRVPADGLLVESHSLQIIEGTNEEYEDTSCLASTFLISGSIVQKGFGLMLVTAVGKDTRWTGRHGLRRSDTSNENTRTIAAAFLAQFETSKDLLEKLMLYIALLFLLILLPFYFTGHYEVDLKRRPPIALTFNLVYAFYDGLTFLVTLVRYSTFRAVSLALLYFIPRMSADRAFILKLETCYTNLSSITTICTGKAGLLTHSEIEVKSSWIAGDLHDNEGHLTPLLNTMPEDIRALLFEGLILNSVGNLNMNTGSISALEESCGSRTEKALLRWGQALLRWRHQNGIPFHAMRETHTVLKVEPFDSERKRSGASLRREGDGNCIVHWKGDAGTILSSCSRWIRVDAESRRTTIMRLSVQDRSDIEAKIANMEHTGMHCVAFAYCEVGPAANSRAQAASGSMRGGCSPAHISLQEVDLTLLAVVGMKETCRPQTTDAVKMARDAGLRVIMVTGHSLESARAIAKECGIIQAESQDIEESTHDQVVDGPTFQKWTPSERKQRLQRLTVLARASVSDKLLLIASLQADERDRKEVVAVTGHKYTDAAVLQKADVGFSLGSGNQVAKESSDIVLVDDSLTSLLKAIKWGRCIRCNLQYFLHFATTMSVAMPLISTLTGTQFQWIDLTTTLATIAVIMQPPLPSLMLQPPIPHDEPLYTNVMVCRTGLQSIYQVILFSMMINYGDPNLKRTIIFNSFIFCQLINIVNARQPHVFQNLPRLDTSQGLLKAKTFLRWCGTNMIQKNLLLLAIITIIAIMQVLLIQFGGPMLSSMPLKWTHWLYCVVLALGGWVVGVLGECLPPMPSTPSIFHFSF